MESFFNKYREHEAGTGQLESVLRPFVGDPNLLSLPAREELIFRYQYLEEGIPPLASEFRVTPRALEEYFEENGVFPQSLSTPQELAEFETHVNETYKSIRIRMSGLVAIQSARAWERLAKAEENLLASLVKATELVHEKASNQFVDARELKQLVDAHAKVVDRQQLIKEAISVPAAADVKGLADALTQSLEDLLNKIDGEGRTLPSERNQ